MTDPDVAYFVETENALSAEYKQLLQDLALICNFKATSDLPQWMTSAERDSLKAFLHSNPRVKRLCRSKFEIDGRLVDFSTALSLPTPPSGFTKLHAAVVGWLGSQVFILKLFRRMEDKSYQKKLDALKNKG
jgi:hypothetical protein